MTVRTNRAVCGVCVGWGVGGGGGGDFKTVRGVRIIRVLELKGNLLYVLMRQF